MAVDAGDAGGYFPAMYARVTSRIADSIDAGRFADGERMGAFASAFAAHYTRARDSTLPCPLLGYSRSVAWGCTVRSGGRRH